VAAEVGAGVTEGRTGFGGGFVFRTAGAGATGAGVSKRTLGGAVVRGTRALAGAGCNVSVGGVASPSVPGATAETCSMQVSGRCDALF